jgi:hypothetical protein
LASVVDKLAEDQHFLDFLGGELDPVQLPWTIGPNFVDVVFGCG